MTEWGLRGRRALASIRTRLLVTVLLVLALGVGGTALVTRQVLMARVDERIANQLTQEVEELRVFAQSGLDPQTGEPFGDDVARLLTVFLQREVPVSGELMVTYLDGQPYQRTAQTVPHRVDTDPDLTARWGATRETMRGVVDTPAGPLHYLAVPVTAATGPHGVFLIGQFEEVVAGEVAQTIRVTAWAALAALLVGTVVATGLARRILVPLNRVTATAREISDTDLSRRLAAEGSDEVAELATTFNAMLDRLETAFEQQRQFIDDAGHELRTPITVIRGHLELLDVSNPEDRADTVALVLDELDRMHRMVEDLLTLARADQPDFIAPVLLDLDDLTTSIHRKALGLSTGHRWVLDEVAVGMVEADGQRVTQAMMQLAANAARHTPTGSTIAIGSAINATDLRLWVRDDGPGIDADDQARIFERFARGAGPRRTDGAGLGLAIVRVIAEAHGGDITLDSTPGHGATFTLRIPRSGPPDPDVSWDDTLDLADDDTRPISLPEPR
jgi:two-component system, OmpR family, sensor kinase